MKMGLSLIGENAGETKSDHYKWEKSISLDLKCHFKDYCIPFEDIQNGRSFHLLTGSVCCGYDAERMW